MIDRHAVHALLRAGQSTKEIATQFGVTRRTIQRIAKEPAVDEPEDAAARRRRGVGRPSVEEAVRLRLRDLLVADPVAPPLEYLHQLREQGVRLGESTFYRIYRVEKAKLPTELMVRFEGVAGEFAQFDFGQADVRLFDGSTRRIHFAAYRLKYSRWVWVVPVPDERIESLVRALLLCFEHSGGVPLRVVFDNPKTVVLARDEHARPIWNQTLAQVAIDYGFVIELCAPRSPEQKGAVENLVGWVKKSFFRARRFSDVEHDLPRQLVEWLTVANEERPSRATKEIPAQRLAAERVRMKPLVIAPAEYGLRYAVQVGPTALVEFQGIRYAMPAGACGIPATLHLYPDRVRIVTGGGRFEATHPRFPRVGTTSYLEGQRAEQLAAVAGARKRLYFMRERILELGPIGESYLTELIHARPHTWKGDVERLFMLLEEMGEELPARAAARTLPTALWLGVRRADRGAGGRLMITPVPLDDVDAMLKRLHLPTIRRLHADLAVRAEQEGMSYRVFLETLCAEEIAHRAQTRITRSVRKARFPYLRTIEEFDFTHQTSVRMKMLGTLLGPELVSEGRCAILSGAPGRGKTHLAVAIAYRAIQNGFEARFITADELIGDLSVAALRGDLDDALEPYVHPHVLVIDELGYQSYAADAANVLFRVVSLRHLRRRPVIVTTNKPLAALGQVLHDGDLAEAILDRLLERGTHYVLRGRSYRTRHLKEDASTTAEDAA